jgi:hypothetical protein
MLPQSSPLPLFFPYPSSGRNGSGRRPPPNRSGSGVHGRSVPRAAAPDPSARHGVSREHGSRLAPRSAPPARRRPDHRAHLPFLTRLLVAAASGYRGAPSCAGQVASRFAVQNDHAHIIRFLPHAARRQLVGYSAVSWSLVWVSRHGGLGSSHGHSSNTITGHTTSVGWVVGSRGRRRAGECAVTCRTPCNAMPPPVPAAIKTAGGIKKVVAEWERSSPAPPTCEISRTGRCSSTGLCATGGGGCWIRTLSFLLAQHASRRAVGVDELRRAPLCFRRSFCS